MSPVTSTHTHTRPSRYSQGVSHTDAHPPKQVYTLTDTLIYTSHTYTHIHKLTHYSVLLGIWGQAASSNFFHRNMNTAG